MREIHWWYGILGVWSLVLELGFEKVFVWVRNGCSYILQPTLGVHRTNCVCVLVDKGTVVGEVWGSLAPLMVIVFSWKLLLWRLPIKKLISFREEWLLAWGRKRMRETPVHFMRFCKWCVIWTTICVIIFGTIKIYKKKLHIDTETKTIEEE